MDNFGNIRKDLKSIDSELEKEIFEKARNRENVLTTVVKVSQPVNKARAMLKIKALGQEKIMSIQQYQVHV